MTSSADDRSGSAGPRFELFHRIEDPASAHIRKRVMALGLIDVADFRNVSYDSHRQAFEAAGGKTVPTIRADGKLWEGEAACEEFLGTLVASR